MADCSQTKVFLSELKRMCLFEGLFCANHTCPMLSLKTGLENLKQSNCFDNMLINNDEAIELVQKWSDAHPLLPSKTYADVFFEQHPKATRLENGRPRAYRCEVYGCECKYKCPPDVIESTFNTDRDPCKICWNEPYPEQEVST